MHVAPRDLSRAIDRAVAVRTCSSSVRCIPPSSCSGAPKSITNGSTPCSARVATADVSGATSYTLLVTMSGGTRINGMGGCPFVEGLDTYRRSRCIGSRSTISNGAWYSGASCPSRIRSSAFFVDASSRRMNRRKRLFVLGLATARR
ncbi:MAG: hypothetical protein U0414_43670 [Polyangiaceae bacterium]